MNNTLSTLLSFILWAAGIGAFLALLLVIFGRGLVNSMAFYPEKQVGATGLISNPAVRELFLKSVDGTKLQAFYFPNLQSDRIILFFHGNAGNAISRFPDAVALSKSPINVLLLSYRGYGRSAGKPSEKGIYMDAEAALAYTRTVLKFPENKTFVLGRSLGSAVAVHLAQDRSLAGLVLVSPFSSGIDMAGPMGLGWLSWAIGNPFDSITKAAGLEIPALFIHGEEDNIIPVAMGEKLFNVYGGKEKEFIKVPAAGHNDLIEVAGDTYWNTIARFIRGRT